MLVYRFIEHPHSTDEIRMEVGIMHYCVNDI